MPLENTIYEFGEFQLDLGEKQLRRQTGEVLPVPPKAFELLTFLVKNEGRLLEKNELMDSVWADSFVEEGNLKINIHNLRKVLNENGEQFIETIPRRGYRFRADVRPLENGELVIEKLTRSKLVIERIESSSPDEGKIAKKSKFILGFLIFAILLVGAVSYLAVFRPMMDKLQSPESSSKLNTIAVLPFKNLTKDKNDEFLSIGLADSLITKLGSVRRISVRPTSAVLAFSESSTAQIVSERLQVETILEGTIQRIGKRLKISVQFVEMPANQILWASSFEENEGDLLKIQESISAQIVKALEVNLNQEERELFAKSSTDSDEAYQFYLKGRFHWNKRTKEDIGKSIEFLESAVEMDEHFALAYAGLAESYQLFAEYGGMAASEAFAKSKKSAERALEINPNLAEAHNSLAYTLAFYDWNWNAAEKEFKKSIELNPNDPTARQWYGEYLLAVGRFDESLDQISRAEQLDPTSLIIASDIAAHAYISRSYEECISHAQKAIQQDEKFSYAYAFLWVCYEQQGNISKAADTFVLGDRISFPNEMVEGEKQAFANGGWQEMWKFKESVFDSLPTNQYINNYVRAFTSLRTGNREKAFEWLEKSYESRERWFVNLKHDPQWDSLRDDPRFSDLVRKANLEP